MRAFSVRLEDGVERAMTGGTLPGNRPGGRLRVDNGAVLDAAAR